MQHPLSLFKFCPVCGTESFAENNTKSKKCKHCGFTYYFNPSAAVVALIENEQGEILVARRAKDPAKGTLDLPGGFVDLGETAEEALFREIFEETNLETNSIDFLFSIPNIYKYSELNVHTVDLFFRCTVSDISPLRAQDDVSELFFVDLKTLNPDHFGMASVRKAINKLKEKRDEYDKKE